MSANDSKTSDQKLCLNDADPLTIIDAIPIGISVIAPDGKTLYVNRRGFLPLLKAIWTTNRNHVWPSMCVECGQACDLLHFKSCGNLGRNQRRVLSHGVATRINSASRHLRTKAK